MRYPGLIIAMAILALVSGLSEADTAEAEIEYLLNTVGESDCTFIRNGKSHDAADARSHLEMKYGRGKRWVDSAEQFIERIASESSFSGDPYQIDCPNQPPQPTGDWLTEQLDDLRRQQD